MISKGEFSWVYNVDTLTTLLPIYILRDEKVLKLNFRSIYSGRHRFLVSSLWQYAYCATHSCGCYSVFEVFTCFIERATAGCVITMGNLKHNYSPLLGQQNWNAKNKVYSYLAVREYIKGDVRTLKTSKHSVLRHLRTALGGLYSCFTVTVSTCCQCLSIRSLTFLLFFRVVLYLFFLCLLKTLTHLNSLT